MLTYREGAVCQASTASFMADHLLERTLPEEAQRLAAYYQRDIGADQHAGTLPRLRRNLSPAVARMLGLDLRRAPRRDELVNLLAGYRADGTKLPGVRRYVRYGDRSNISYIDFTWSADKSVSLAWAFAETGAERAMIARAHRDAVHAAMEYVTTVLGVTRRRGADGDIVSIPGEIGWIEFDHYTSRPTAKIATTEPDGTPTTVLQTVMVSGDPQLHTHVIIPNAVRTAEGHVGAIAREFEGRVKEFGAYYQAQLAQNLRRHGAEVVLDPETGAGRLVAIPVDVRAAFSRRTQGAERAARDYARRQGLDWDVLTPAEKIKLLKGGARATRAGKGDDLGDRVAWQALADELGWQHRTIMDLDRRWLPAPDEDRLQRAYVAALPFLEGQLARRAVLPEAEARTAAARGLVAAGVRDANDIDTIVAMMRTHGVRQRGKTVALLWGEDHDGAIKITTTLHVEEEETLIGLAARAAADRSAALTPGAIARAVALTTQREGLDFSGEHGDAQRRVIDRLATGGRLAVAIGVAGAGKTTLLKPLVDAWRSDGREVWGAALAWRHSDLLQEAGLDETHSMALSRLIRRIHSGQIVLTDRSVVVVDELGLIGTHALLELLQLREQYGFSIVALGDPLQAQAIDAGAVIPLLQRALGEDAVPSLERSVRQRRRRDRETALLFRAGDAAAAIARKRADGTVVLVPGGHEDAVRRVAELWEDRIQANRDRRDYTLTVSAPTNGDARAIASEIRARRRRMGEVGADAITLDATDQAGVPFALPLAVGDRVRLFRSVKVTAEGARYRRNLGRNGTVASVTAIRAEGLVLRNDGGVEGFVPFDELRDAATGRVLLTYGDVLSIDAIQSATSTEHIDAMPAGTQAVHGFKAYVAESRSRETTWLVLSDGAEREEIAHRRPLNDRRPITEDEVYVNVARNLSRQPEKDSALAMLDRVRNVQAGSVRAMQEALHRSESRQAQGQPATTMRERQQAARDEAAVTQALQRLVAAADGQQPTDERTKDEPTDGAGEGQGALPSAEQESEEGDHQALAVDDRAHHQDHLSEPRAISETEAQAEFAEEVRRAGLRVEGQPVMDGHLHRVTVEGDRRGKKSGAYVGHLDGLPAGFIRNFKTGETIRWRASGATRALSAEEMTHARAQPARWQLEREHERRTEEEVIARRMRALWRRAAPAYRHPYLERKGVAEHGLRVDASGRLLVPMHDADGVIWSMQTITTTGDMLHEKGGRTHGMHVLLGELAPGSALIITEGFATAATLIEATGLPTVAAFDAGNLLAVAETYRARDVGRPIIIVAGDNDHPLPPTARHDGTVLPNGSREKADAAALAVHGLTLTAPISSGASGTDWNDYAALYGLDAVRRAVAEPLAQHGITLHSVPRETYMASRPAAMAVRREAARRRHTTSQSGLRQESERPRAAREQPSDVDVRPAIQGAHPPVPAKQADRDAARRRHTTKPSNEAQANRQRVIAQQQMQQAPRQDLRPGLRPA